MNNEEILANAPEGATHVDDDFGYWILSEDQNIKSQAWIDTRKGFRALSTDGFSFRSLADIERILELENYIDIALDNSKEQLITRVNELEKALIRIQIEGGLGSGVHKLIDKLLDGDK